MTWGKGRLNLEQLAAQNASQAEDARTEQHDAAGLRSRAGGAGRGAGAGGGAAGAVKGEGLGRNGSDRVLGSRGRTRVLIPINRIAGCGRSVRQVQPVGASVQRRTRERARLGADVEAVLVR